MPDQFATNIIALIKNRAVSNGADIDIALDGAEITTTTKLTSLGVDSLGMADILWDLEQAHGIKIDFNTADAWSNLDTIGDVVEAVRSFLNKED
ncbi:acyl carrier protein [Mesorhizobium sp. J8]|uniref:acyl carrier protein n=1 Tax=Mesorhizobium sp. J8 TaxID=2777475 RepID=UPI001915F37F|nr:acyl carrier protein [Mesorhizobium sp. J8]BCM17544.1 nodulation protein; NodF [Mesorhizobium sp. J8]